MSEPPLRAWTERDGALLRLRLARPKANVLDAAMLEAFAAALAPLETMPALRAILIDAEGPHFSFGASVEEHLPASCAAMLRGFHAVLLRLLEAPAPVVVAVRGQCLGGGMELALTGTRIVADTEARFGQPEIRLGVFAPMASALLPERIGRPAAEAMLLSGATLSADAAHAAGLVQAVVADPEAAALAWIEKELLDKSAAALRLALRAARIGFARPLRARLEELETLYLDELMRTHDASEGLRAFLERRPPHWEHR
ncbi:MAG: cyclohexa-1,5-dienecarbonyl-CoA hydratase [Rhodospirillales bacterium]|nr:cyclohexa-1,5-dienecarbonyl-CoA hydratase [Rhodospirillales bacterium]